jgi:hypothetical protein
MNGSHSIAKTGNSQSTESWKHLVVFVLATLSTVGVKIFNIIVHHNIITLLFMRWYERVEHCWSQLFHFIAVLELYMRLLTCRPSSLSPRGQKIDTLFLSIAKIKTLNHIHEINCGSP